MKKVVTILFVVALVLGRVITALPAAASTVTWYVVEGGGGDETGVSWAEAFADVQDAVDAARPGDTIRVAAGNYGAFSVIGKASISIIGDEGAVVAAGDWFSVDRGPIADAWTMAAVKDSQDIRIQGIDFAGGALSELEVHREVVVGIAYVDSTGVVADLSVENTMGAELGVGVAVTGHAGASVVDLAGVSIENSMVGVIVWDAEADLDGCVITGMRPGGGFDIMDRGVGIVVGIPGVAWHGPSTVKVRGSTISDNEDIGIYVCDGSVVEAHFNNIVGNAALGVLNDGGQRVDALHNWWGDSEGPFGPKGNAVSSDVDFWPWAAARVVTVTVENGIVNARAEADTEVEVKGKAMVTVTRYLTDPGAGADITVPFATQGEYAGIYPMGKWIDVSVTDVSEVEELEIKLYYTGDELGDLSAYEKYLRLFWWDGTQWVECSDTDLDMTAADPYISASIGRGTSPSLANLDGTPFGGYGSPPPIPVPCGCFIATAAYGTESAAEIGVLKEFRNAVLLTNRVASRLVSLYYRAGPPVAALISRCGVLRAAVRVGLIAPIVSVLHGSQDMWLTTRP
ncbi:MAG: CFI-box-CTERM domain-containing protein [Dehalococcoidia bacterium]